jgi:hypothetical protein
MHQDTGNFMRRPQRPPVPAPREINLNERYQVKDWTKTLGVTEVQLRRAISKVGTSEDAVRKFLNDKKGLAS